MISPLAGQPAPQAALIDASRLISAYFQQRPDPVVTAQRVAFGTSGHRGSAFERSFNEWHVLAITQAVCDCRRAHDISGPLFLGVDTHALSAPACASACEVLAANGVELMLAAGEEYTPTPAISHAILAHNHDRFPMRTAGLADGIVITPSHNPPGDGGFKYNPPHGGPAGLATSRWIEAAANRYLETGLAGVRRMTLAAALRAPSTHRHDYRSAYVADLGQVIDMEAIRHAGPHLGVDPLGGAGVHYWAAIAERYGLDLSVLSEDVDPTFRFMTLDWDGQIRLDPASPYAMQRLIACKNHFDLAFACDTDHDRHGIVTPADGLLAPNHYLCVAIDYLFRHRPHWSAQLAIGKTVVSTQLIDRVAARLGRKIFETPVGFKWFASGLLAGSLGFAGEGKRRCQLPAARGFGVDHRQGWHCRRIAGSRDHRRHRRGSRCALCPPDPATRPAHGQTNRRRSHAPAKTAAGGAVAGANFLVCTGRRTDRIHSDPRTRQWRCHWRHQARHHQRLVRCTAIRHRTPV